MVLQNPNVTGHISEESPYWQIIAVSKTCQVVCGADCRRPAIANTSRHESKTRRKSLDKNYTKCSCSSVHNYNEHRRNVFLRSPRREGHARTKSYLAGVRYNNLVGTTYISCARDATFFLHVPAFAGSVFFVSYRLQCYFYAEMRLNFSLKLFHWKKSAGLLTQSR